MVRQLNKRPPEIRMGDHIRKWRNLRDVKQSELAAHLGIKNAAMSNIENNKAGISNLRLGAIAQKLRIEVPMLMIDPSDLLRFPAGFKQLADFE